jgi:hypothetical protein
MSKEKFDSVTIHLLLFVDAMYNRLFTKILDSSIWLEKDVTRIVWITMLAAMDEDGFCAFSCEENLARRANVPLEGLQEALKVLQSPDRFNREDEFQGRRIERVENGWTVLKARYYRDLLTREIAREKTRIRVAEWRAKQAHVTARNIGNKPVTQHSIAEHSKAKQSKRPPFIPPERGECVRYAKEIGMKESDVESWFDHFTSNGWKVGGRAPMKDWRAALRNGMRRQRRFGGGGAIGEFFDDYGRRKSPHDIKLEQEYEAHRKAGL